MIKSEIVSIIFGLISLLLSFAGYFLYIKGELYKKTEDAVNNAEIEGKLGEEKLALAVEQLYLTVPRPLRAFITRDEIKIIVQNAFDKIEEFAKKQVRKCSQTK